MAATRKRKLGPMQAQEAAQKYVQNYITTKTLGLPANLSEEEFKLVMDTIVKVMIQSWAEGYYTE
jgi:hypothetical protein